MHGGMSCFATQSPYEDVGDGAVVEPDEANSVANSDDAAAVTGLHAHAKQQRSDGWTSARTASECAKFARRSAP